MAFTEDPADFLDTTHGHAVTATIGASSVDGVFEDAYFGVESGGAEIAGSRPRFYCWVAHLPAITLGSTTAIVSGTTYTIMASEPDGTGWTFLVLQEP